MIGSEGGSGRGCEERRGAVPGSSGAEEEAAAWPGLYAVVEGDRVREPGAGSGCRVWWWDRKTGAAAAIMERSGCIPLCWARGACVYAQHPPLPSMYCVHTADMLCTLGASR